MLTCRENEDTGGEREGCDGQFCPSHMEGLGSILLGCTCHMEDPVLLYFLLPCVDPY